MCRKSLILILKRTTLMILNLLSSLKIVWIKRVKKAKQKMAHPPLTTNKCFKTSKNRRSLLKTLFYPHTATSRMNGCLEMCLSDSLTRSRTNKWWPMITTYLHHTSLISWLRFQMIWFMRLIRHSFWERSWGRSINSCLLLFTFLFYPMLLVTTLCCT